MHAHRTAIERMPHHEEHACLLCRAPEAQHAQPTVVGAQSHSYRTYATPGELVTQYLAYLADVKARVRDPSYALNAAIYTEARPPYGAGTLVHSQ